MNEGWRGSRFYGLGESKSPGSTSDSGAMPLEIVADSVAADLGVGTDLTSASHVTYGRAARRQARFARRTARAPWSHSSIRPRRKRRRGRRGNGDGSAGWGPHGSDQEGVRVRTGESQELSSGT
jgi:hypothetical protein